MRIFALKTPNLEICKKDCRLRRMALLGLLPLLFLSCTENLIFHPQRGFFFDPKSFGWEYENLWIPVKNNLQIHAWRLYNPRTLDERKKNFIVYLHGNAGNITSQFLSVGWLLDAGFEVFAFDYPGYGMSSGTATSDLVYESSLGVLRHFHRRAVKQNRGLVVFAQSLGSTIALWAIPRMSEKARIRLLLVEGSFDSFQDLAYTKTKSFCIFPFTWGLSKLVSDQYSPGTSISKIAPIPLIIVHGEKDPIVPIQYAHRVFQLAKQPKEIYIIKDGGHLNWLSPNSRQLRKYIIKKINIL